MKQASPSLRHAVLLEYPPVVYFVARSGELRGEMSRWCCVALYAGGRYRYLSDAHSRCVDPGTSVHRPAHASPGGLPRSASELLWGPPPCGPDVVPVQNGTSRC